MTSKADFPYCVANAALDVFVTELRVEDNPCRLRISMRVGLQFFWSEITYHSIASWEEVRGPLGDLRFQALIGVIAAWDAMRFMALGGTRLVIDAEWPVRYDDATRKTWQYCFNRQFAEWRFRNKLRYPADDGPQLVGGERFTDTARESADAVTATTPYNRMLLANGGGKDTLASMIVLREVDASFDLYEGYMPLGGDAALQERLLSRLSSDNGERDVARVRTSVRDNFFDCPESEFLANGVTCRHYKGDFMVGHTANYAGYFPLIVAGGYTRVLFSIEKSADVPQVYWDGEPINHQWCKSAEYRDISRQMFRNLTGFDYFSGFESPIAGLYDFGIYRIIANSPAELVRTHSCNYHKPWCRRCTKCLFCYLMMTAFFSEQFAARVVGASCSLFADPSLAGAWNDLLLPESVAWKCVPGKEECRLAVSLCWHRGLRYPVIENNRLPDELLGPSWMRYATLDADVTPPHFGDAIARLLDRFNAAGLGVPGVDGVRQTALSSPERERCDTAD